MAINFRRRQVMEQLGIEAISSPPVERDEPVSLVQRDGTTPIRAQQIFGLAVAPPAMVVEEAREQPINPDGPMCDMTVRTAVSAADMRGVDVRVYFDPVLNQLQVPARKCPTCEASGTTTWVMPGKECPRCNSVVDQSKPQPGY